MRGWALVATVLLAGCAVGPDFHRPAPPTTSDYTREALPTTTAATDVAGGEAQHWNRATELPGEWWTLFGSDSLNALIDQAMHRYPTLAVQQAALRAARENVRAEEGVFFPQAQGSFQAAREKQSGTLYGPGFSGFISSVYQANVNVSYALDLFGGERRALEGAQAQAEQQRFELEASYLTLTSNVAATAIALASAREQIAATNEVIALEQKQLDIIERQFELGSQTRADVLQQQSNLAGVRATLPALQQQQALAEHALAVLTGAFPHDAPEVALTLADLRLPQELPLTLPSVLVEQRPDIKIQELAVHQASAAVGVATSNLLPQLNLTAALGDESLRLSSMFNGGTATWSVAAGLTQPLFEGGTLRAKRRAAIDTYQASAAQYQLVVLQAFQNVADTLTALQNDAAALKAQYDALTASKASLDFVQRQYDAGAVNYVALLTTQQSYQQARLAYARAMAARYTDTVALFQALGGGWWHRQDVAADGQSRNAE